MSEWVVGRVGGIRESQHNQGYIKEAQRSRTKCKGPEQNGKGTKQNAKVQNNMQRSRTILKGPETKQKGTNEEQQLNVVCSVNGR